MSHSSSKPKYDWMTPEDLDKLFADLTKTVKVPALEASLKQTHKKLEKNTREMKKDVVVEKGLGDEKGEKRG